MPLKPQGVKSVWAEDLKADAERAEAHAIETNKKMITRENTGPQAVKPVVSVSVSDRRA